MSACLCQGADLTPATRRPCPVGRRAPSGSPILGVVRRGRRRRRRVEARHTGLERGEAFRLKREGDPERVRALLDLSGWATALPGATLAPLGFVAGIAAGFMGNWWGQAWIWISLALFVAVGIAMTPMVASRLNAIRAAAGAPSVANPFSRKPLPPAPEPDPVQLRSLLNAWNPLTAAVMGLGAFVIILWLMFFKPF
jgi:uncharacterized membrane protein